jgi:hypothetical protein
MTPPALDASAAPVAPPDPITPPDALVLPDPVTPPDAFGPPDPAMPPVVAGADPGFCVPPVPDLPPLPVPGLVAGVKPSPSSRQLVEATRHSARKNRIVLFISDLLD